MDPIACLVLVDGELRRRQGLPRLRVPQRRADGDPGHEALPSPARSRHGRLARLERLRLPHIEHLRGVVVRIHVHDLGGVAPLDGVGRGRPRCQPALLGVARLKLDTLEQVGLRWLHEAKLVPQQMVLRAQRGHLQTVRRVCTLEGFQMPCQGLFSVVAVILEGCGKASLQRVHMLSQGSGGGAFRDLRRVDDSWEADFSHVSAGPRSGQDGTK
mmetsp:Transcript_1352/g.3959  ORF Transcript_1352/g.3959 Transcript_1352/m.3959 type:complete len:214 (+) Transcript_1352:1787-2428(+)